MKKLLSILFLCFALASSPMAQELPQVPDQAIEALQFPFNGQWMPSVDPLQIGPENYRVLTNLRYNPSGSLESVGGYSKINTTVLAGTPQIDAGFHFKKDNPAETHVLINADGTVYQNTTAIPSQGDFAATALHTDAAGAGAPRFSQAPYGNVVYANGVETMIWGGNEMPVAAFITSTAAVTQTPINPKDFTEAVNNSFTTAQNVATVTHTFLIGSPRPLQGVKLYISSANVSASTLTVSEWQGSAWVALVVTDNTDTGPSLGQTGTVTWTNTGLAKVKFIENRLYYWYQFTISAGTAGIYRTTIDAPWQNLVDMWDGVYRQPIQCQVYKSTKYEDYSYDVSDESADTYYADLGGLTNAEHIILMFDDRTTTLSWVMVAGKENTTAATVTIYYWDGTNWTTVGTVNDTTLDSAGGTKSLGQSGTMSWTPPNEEVEFYKTSFGVTGYAYKLVWSATLTASNAQVNTLYGVPAQKIIRPFKFPAMYKDRLFLCGYSEGGEGNRCDYSMAYTPQVFNGAESSDDGTQSLYFGGGSDLTAATQLYNRMGSNIFIFFLALKEGETYVLIGDGPDTYQIYPVSTNIGCPAPKSLVVAEVGFDIASDVQRHVALWVSYAGPVIFDGAVIYQIPGLEIYFDPNSLDYLGQTSIRNFFGWFDQTYKEYNIVCGSFWVAYNLKLKRWFRKDVNTAEYPISAWPVRDTYGNELVYAGLDNGYMMRLENGTTWDEVGIIQRVQTGDFWPTKNMWDLTRLRRIKLVAKRILSANSTLSVVHYADCEEIAVTGVTWESNVTARWTDTSTWWWSNGNSLFSMDISGASSGYRERVIRSTAPVNLLAWTHALRFEVTTDDTEKGFQPIIWGVEYLKERRDH